VKLFEAVPNFSEGRDAAKIERIVQAGRSVDGVTVLDVESDAAHHRSVVTIAGAGAPVSEALFRMIKLAVETIDLTHHSGEHPRMGAADVVPFVPFGEATIEEASALAERLGHRVWTELGLPVYLYANSARRPERADLAHLRRGGFEGIRATIATDPDRAPDIGEPRVHPTAGIVAIGARPVLIAYNANLATPDVRVAKAIAHAIREKDGGLPAVKALGFEVGVPPHAQVSMNLTDHHRTPVHVALEAVRAEAAKRGTTVESSEIVGLVPEESLLAAAEHYLALVGFDRNRILERRIAGALAPANAPPASDLAGLPLDEFVARVAARTPTPGGGSVAAATAAMGAALAEMAIRFSLPPAGRDPEFEETLGDLGRDRTRLLELVDADAASYEAVRTARRARKGDPENADLRQTLRMALRTASEVPLETARLARQASDLGRRVQGRIKPAIASDLTTGLALLDAALAGAAANVSVNLKDLAAEGIDVRGLSAELKELLGEAR
jgi:glutamate formiminotransferase / formiminotetrahydrofolate cyclodeaminase